MNKSNLSLIIPITNNNNLNNIIQRINFYYPILLSLIATIGNIISFFVFSSKIFKNNASGFYLRMKAITDILNVYIGTLRFTYTSQTGGRDLKDLASFVCYFFSISVYTIDPFTSWLNVFTSLDRLVLVLKPSFYKSISNKALKRFQILIILFTFSIITGANLLKLLYMSFVSYDIHNNVTNQTIHYKKCLAGNAILIDWINIFLTLLLPFVIMTASSSIMAYNLIKSKSKLNKNKKKNSGFWSKNIAFIKTVVCLDICFLMFNLPRFILQLIKGTTPTFTFILQISTVFKYSYYSLTIVFYLSTNNLFREILYDGFCIFLSKSKIVVYKKNAKVRPAPDALDVL